MALHGLGIRPLIDNLGEAVDHKRCKQSCYADNSSAGGQLIEMKRWWDQLCLKKLMLEGKDLWLLLEKRDPRFLAHSPTNQIPGIHIKQARIPG